METRPGGGLRRALESPVIGLFAALFFAIVIGVVIAMRHDVRWLLIFAWPCAIAIVYETTRIFSTRSDWKCIIIGIFALISGVLLIWLYLILAPETEVPSKAEDTKLLFGCERAKLPSRAPPSGRIAILDPAYFSEGGHATGLGGRIGDPGEVWDWEPYRQTITYECKVINYGSVPIFNLHFALRASFYNGPSANFNKDAPVYSYDHDVLIQNIDGREGDFTFYLGSSRKQIIHVVGPENVSFLRAGGAQREAPILLPGSDINVIVGGKPTNPPAASLPSPALPASPSKK